MTKATNVLLILISLFAFAPIASPTFIPNDPFEPSSQTYSITTTRSRSSTPHQQPPKKAETSRRTEALNMRAWTCHGRTQREMVDKLASAGIIQSPSVRESMYKVDRANYAGGSRMSGAYNDNPQPIGYGQTISAPHMHAHALEELLPTLVSAARDRPNQDLRILDVGCGSGYLTACLGRLVDRGPAGPIDPLVKGYVFGIDAFPELVDFTRSNMKTGDADLFESGTVTLQVGDGWVGLPDVAPFDAIHVGAAAANFPQALMMQLAVGGVMVCPVGPDGGIQNLYRIEKVRESPTFDENDFAIKNLLGVRYVPLFHP